MGQGGCERRTKVFVKNKKWGGGSGRRGVRVDVNEELKFLGKITKKSGDGREGGSGGVGLVGGQGGCERNVGGRG